MIGSIKRFVIDYLSRHRNNIDRLLHIIGVPLVFFAIYQLLTRDWKSGLINFFIGYLLQWIGHTCFEKNEVGEWILMKKIANKLAGRR